MYINSGPTQPTAVLGPDGAEGRGLSSRLVGLTVATVRCARPTGPLCLWPRAAPGPAHKQERSKEVTSECVLTVSDFSVVYDVDPPVAAVRGRE